MRTVVPTLCLLLVSIVDVVSAQTGLEKQLLAEPSESLSSAARKLGDARRGAILFYQPYMACRKCHSVGGKSPLGPDLSKIGKKATDVHLVESVLLPSKVIAKEFRPTVVLTAEGKSVTGLPVESTPEKLVLREGRPDGTLVTIARDDIDELMESPTSIMPAGQINQLASRQQFLDLIRYLMEVRDGGAIRAKELEPPPQLYAVRIPEYEKTIDHAGMIRDLDDKSYKRGEAIYNRLCINCHGTHDRPGSLPTSVRFATGRLRNGHDPFSMYQTLTGGFGMMVAQTWMVPEQKYDVIHYIREAYLKTHNPRQYAQIDGDYLSRLPKGDSRGPKPSNVQRWAIMDYGPSLINTYEFGSDRSNFAYKGIAVRLDAGPGGISRGRAWMVFDHDTMRVAGTWTGQGFIDWNGIHFNGRHGIHPRVIGMTHQSIPSGPGWSNPDDPGFVDPRLRGRDGDAYGPLPRSWARYHGLYHFRDKAIIDYSIGRTRILESPGLVGAVDSPLFTRTFNIGPRSEDLVLKVAHLNTKGNQLLNVDAGPKQFVAFGHLQSAQKKQERKTVTFDGSTFFEVGKGTDFDVKGSDFTITARIRTRKGGTILSRTKPGKSWIPGGRTLFVRGGRLCFDIGWVGVVQSPQRIDDGEWHDVAMSWDARSQIVRLFVDGQTSGEGKLNDERPIAGSVLRIGFTNPDFPRNGSFFNGNLEDVRFYQRRLTDEELKKTGKLPVDPSLIGHWKPNEVNENRTKDRSGRGHAGVLHQDQPSGGGENPRPLLAGLQPSVGGVRWHNDGEGSLLLRLPAGDRPLRFSLWFRRAKADENVSTARLDAEIPDAGIDLAPFTNGGPPRWRQKLTTPVIIGKNDGPYTVDTLLHPAGNPWLAQVRLTGFDFLPDNDRVAVCAWDGDVWMVSGLKQLAGLTEVEEGTEPPKLTWQRIASGLFQPLGLKVIDGKTLYVTCRDQIVILRDLNGDGETDYYENFNNDHQVTEHFHEFAMGLQTDDEGNFYYAKSARHALKAVVPHHGTLLKVSKDGSKTEILATGFRAANGVCLNPDGSFIVTDQEGHWNPKNRINWVRKGGFYGNMFGYHNVTDSSDSAMKQPLCWITNSFDRSPAELLWCDSDRWGPLQGSLLNLSYGYGQVYVVPHEEIDGQMQGGMCALPLPRFPTGIMRGRFYPGDGQLYTCGMFAWAGNQQQPGGFYRIRYTGKPVHLPVGLRATKQGIQLTFTEPLDKESAMDAGNYRIKVWDLKRTASYGSKHYNEHDLEVTSAVVSADRQTVSLTVPDIARTWSMEIRYSIRSDKGKPVDGVVHNTIHKLSP